MKGFNKIKKLVAQKKLTFWPWFWPNHAKNKKHDHFTISPMFHSTPPPCIWKPWLVRHCTDRLGGVARRTCRSSYFFDILYFYREPESRKPKVQKPRLGSLFLVFLPKSRRKQHELPSHHPHSRLVRHCINRLVEVVRFPMPNTPSSFFFVCTTKPPTNTPSNQAKCSSLPSLPSLPCFSNIFLSVRWPTWATKSWKWNLRTAKGWRSYTPTPPAKMKMKSVAG